MAQLITIHALLLEDRVLRACLESLGSDVIVASMDGLDLQLVVVKVCLFEINELFCLVHVLSLNSWVNLSCCWSP